MSADPTDLEHDIDVVACDMAIAVLRQQKLKGVYVFTEDVGAIGQLWRGRAAERLMARAQRQLRQGLPITMPDGEQQAMSIIRDVAAELMVAGEALAAAAKQLRDDGKGFRASQAYAAGQRAKAAAEELVGHA